MTPEEFAAGGLSYLRETTFLALLEPEEQDRLIEAGRQRVYPSPGAELVAFDDDRPEGIWLIGAGTVSIQVRVNRTTVEVERRGAGQLVGAKELTDPDRVRRRVVTLSPVQALFLSAATFARLRAGDRGFADWVDNLRKVRRRSAELTTSMAQTPVLASLGRRALGRLLDAAELDRRDRNEDVVTSGGAADSVYLLHRGRVGVYADPSAAMPHIELVAPALVGHFAVARGEPHRRTVRAHRRCTLLRIPRAAFEAALKNDPRAWAALRGEVSRADGDERWALDRSTPRPALIVTVYADAPKRGSTTLAYGMAERVARRTGQKVIVLDLQLADTAGRLGFPIVPGKTGRTARPGLEVPPSWRVREVIGAPARADLPSFVERLKEHAACVVVSALPSSATRAEVVQASDGIVYVVDDHGCTWDDPSPPGQIRVRAVRTTGSREDSQGQVRHVVRVPHDPETADSFWDHRDLRALTVKEHPLGRACRRLARVFMGRTFGLALGGGGALGFGHIGLIRALHDRGLEVDVVAGTSFGAVVAGVYAASGLKGLEELLRRGLRNVPPAAMATFTSAGIGAIVDGITDHMPVVATEIPFIPVSADITRSVRFQYGSGTVGTAVRSSVGAPGLFAPLIVEGGARLVDGGVVNNVPVEEVHDAGADFVLGSSVIPRRPAEAGLLWRVAGRVPLAGRAVRRSEDLMRSLYLLMHTTGFQHAQREIDFIVDLSQTEIGFMAFHRGRAISRLAERTVRGDLIEEIVDRYEHDEIYFAGAVRPLPAYDPGADA